jgi:H+/Cl- antiporter ClcA
MVSAGAGVGVSVAFGAPIGGVLFAYEVSKANNYWTFGIAWRTFLSTSVANFALTLLVALKDQRFDAVTNSGLLKFSHIDLNAYDLGDVFIFAIIGILAGILGSLYIYINSNMAKFRKYVLKDKYIKLIEAGLFGFVGATVLFFIPAAFNCQTVPKGEDDELVKAYTCMQTGGADVTLENPLATLLYSTEGDTLRFFLSRITDSNAVSIWVSVVFFLIWFLFCAVEYGIAVPAGLFFPGMLMGASLGEFVALIINKISHSLLST